MPFEAAVAIAILILVATTIGMVTLLASRQQAAREDEWKQASSARGWKLEIVTERYDRVHRWTGTTDGVPWTAESVVTSSGGSHGKHRSYVGRWHGAFSPGINAPIAVMGVPKGKEHALATVADGQTWVARLAQKAAGFAFDKGLDAYFGDAIGKQVDAAALHRIDGERIAGFMVMAGDKDEGARVLAQGLEKALVDASNEPSSLLSEEKRPWVLLRPTGISLARKSRIGTIEELDAYVRAGVGLTRAFKFGRRLSA